MTEVRKRRKVDQEKDEAAGTEPMEETREKRPAEEEVERDNKRPRPGGPEARQARRSTDERRDSSTEVDGLRRREIEEDEYHIARLEPDADGYFGNGVVGDLELEEGFHDDRTRGTLGSLAGCGGEVGRGRVYAEDRAPPGGGQRGVPRDDREATDQHPTGGCEQGVNGVGGCPMQARGGISSMRERRIVGHLRRNAFAGGEEAPIPKGGRRAEGVVEREVVPAEDQVDGRQEGPPSWRA